MFHCLVEDKTYILFQIKKIVMWYIKILGKIIYKGLLKEGNAASFNLLKF